MCRHFCSYLRGAQFTLRTDHRSLRWLQKFRNSDGILARWYMLLGQFSVTFEYRPGSQHPNADGISRQCGQCLRPDCPVSSPDIGTRKTESTSKMVDQPFVTSAMGDSMDSDLLPELSDETWVAATHLDEITGNLSIDSDDRLWCRRAAPAMALQLVVPTGERRGFIQRYYNSIFAGHLGVSRTVYRLLDRVYWPGLREDVRSYLASCSVCLARKSFRDGRKPARSPTKRR